MQTYGISNKCKGNKILRYVFLNKNNEEIAPLINIEDKGYGKVGLTNLLYKEPKVYDNNIKEKDHYDDDNVRYIDENGYILKNSNYEMIGEKKRWKL